MASIVDTDKWAPFVGRLMLGFSILEGSTFDALRLWTYNEVIFKYLKKSRFSERIDILLELVEFQNYKPENVAFYTKQLLELKGLVRYRNLVAHNSLALVLFIEEDDTPLREAIVSNRDEPRGIEFDELISIVSRVEQLAKLVNEALARFKLESIN